MDNIILFDDPKIRGKLLPFTFTRPVAEIRVGILKISEKWEKHFSLPIGFYTQDYLQQKFPLAEGPAYFINGALCPNEELLAAIRNLAPNDALYHQGNLLALRVEKPAEFTLDKVNNKARILFENPIHLITANWKIFQLNGAEIRNDYTLLIKNRVSAEINDPYTNVYNASSVFLEVGATVKAATLNAENGPIYVGKNAQISEGALIRGPFAIAEGAVVSMGAKMRGDITVGPGCKVGGEVSNSVFFGFSNKSHDGYLGNSVIGEWCNLGANTNNSNLKNNYSNVKVWDYTKGGIGDSGLRFCGSFIGDHSKLGINTMLNTGTVIGVGANIFGEGFPRKFVSSFAWGGASGFNTFQLKKFEESARKVMELKNRDFDDNERAILQKVFEITRPYRIWDKEL